VDFCYQIIPIGTGGDNVDTITARLQKKLDTYNENIDRNYKLSISVGVAYHDPDRPSTIDELLIKADALTCEQKGAGRMFDEKSSHTPS
jgi:GGDEF domain-containing protein